MGISGFFWFCFNTGEEDYIVEMWEKIQDHIDHLFFEVNFTGIIFFDYYMKFLVNLGLLLIVIG